MHKEYKRIVPNADTAVLFIHGIIGTPNHFTDFVRLVPDEISVYNVLLDGHGKDVATFAKTSMKKWEAQIAAAVDELAQTHQTISIVAHSMGCLLAVEQAIRHPKVRKLFLLAIPLKLFLRPQFFTTSLKVYGNKIRPDDAQALAAKRCCGIEHHKNPLRYIGWIPRFTELFKKIRKTRRLLPSLSVPCRAYQSANDEMVSQRSEQLLQKNTHILVVTLKNSTHYYYDKDELAFLVTEFTTFIQ